MDKFYLVFSMFAWQYSIAWKTSPNSSPIRKLKLMEQVRQVLRYHHYAYCTEQYCDWIVRYIKFHGSQTHPSQMGKVHIDAFLSHLATQGRVSASTQRQALNAIIFLYLMYSTSRLKIGFGLSRPDGMCARQR